MTRYPGRTIRRAFGEPVTLIHRDVGDYNDHGEWVPGDDERVDTKAASAALSGQELTTLRVPLRSGFRLQDIRRFWIREEADVLVEGEHSGDQIIWRGDTYTLIEKRHWELLGSFGGYLGQKEEARGG